ncbi:MAG: isopentenyl-diphosphate delta-isomerase [Oligoflexia bacterium]|nr:isopentenyl-diphosphate delta-isomerase [Oligoflexia bacterium]
MSDRKIDHIKLAKLSSVEGVETQDHRFYYEPMLSSHPHSISGSSRGLIKFLGYNLGAPLWISSMVGGSSNSTPSAFEINMRLARVAKEFSLGMGVGSCRKLLECKCKGKERKEYLKDFDLREIIGNELPFYANLGIAQIEQLLKSNSIQSVIDLMDELRASGLIVHVNPLQEWLQSEGDHFTRPPIDIIKDFLDKLDKVDKFKKCNIIIKEVGQGMGPKSIEEILKLPIKAFEFAAFGGTNFSKLEILRGENIKSKSKKSAMNCFVSVGHSAEEMVMMVNDAISNLGEERALCKEFIISGGIRDFMDGYYLMSRLNHPSIYGYAFKFLNLAQKSYNELRLFVENEIKCLQMAQNFLAVKF